MSRASSHASSHTFRGPLYGSIHIPDVGVAAILRNAPANLRRRAVAVLDGRFPLWSVMSTNRAARAMGVRPGMVPSELEQFRDLEIRRRSPKQEEATHQALLDCAAAFTPRIEDSGKDTITLDLDGLSMLHGSPRTIAQCLLQAAARLGLEAHVALAPNPDAAIAAARARAGITVIHPGEADRKLGDLGLDVLDPPEAVREVLRRWGIRTFRELGALPAPEVAARLGDAGLALRKRALGIAERPLVPVCEPLHMAESIELEEPVGSLEPLTFVFNRLLNQLCRRLTSRSLSTRALDVSLSLEKAPPLERRIQLPVPTRTPRTLLRLLELDLEAHRLPAPVTGVTLTAEPVAPRRVQEDLFRPRVPEPEKLDLTLARIGAIVGKENVGMPALLDSDRPDAFRIRRFSVVTPLRGRRSAGGQEAQRPRPASPTALRISRPPQPVTVESEKGRPARLLFDGKRSTVVTSAGPWEASGDWWRSDAWSREEWDVEVRTGWRRTLYRIFRDPRRDRWFIDGTYD